VGGEATLAGGYLIVLARGHPELRPRVALLVKVAASAIPAIALALLTDRHRSWPRSSCCRSMAP
jgi:hypothetical protein